MKSCLRCSFYILLGGSLILTIVLWIKGDLILSLRTFNREVVEMTGLVTERTTLFVPLKRPILQQFRNGPPNEPTTRRPPLKMPCVEEDDEGSLQLDSAELKKILIWNGAERAEMATFGLGHDAFVRNKCWISNCILTTNTSLIPVEKFDAILFNIPRLFNVTSLPDRRRRMQRYVYFSQESQFYNNERMADYRFFFNWTMSFQEYSDVPLRYGRIEGLPHSKEGYYQPLGNKTKLVAWFASHCVTQSKRELYVKEMQAYVSVDVYGLCGPNRCDWESTGVSSSHCLEMLHKNYKFYLSFENSFCNDYVTEKFFSILQYDVVPVVLGRANYSQVAPPNSFIDARLYTPKELVDYLILLNSNDSLYNEYFQWKKYYRVHTGLEQMTQEGIYKW